MSISQMNIVFGSDCTWTEIPIHPAIIKCVMLGICECGVFQPYDVFVGHVAYLTNATHTEIDTIVKAAIERGVIDRVSLDLKPSRLVKIVDLKSDEPQSYEQETYEPLTSIQQREKAITAERNRIKPRVRFKVFQAAGNRCAICGRSADDGVVLHVDHIVALANGGTSDIENLQVLCQECNIGKGAL